MTPAITLVSSQDLRAHLSDYLQRARQGERITITVHGRPVAVLGPYDPVGTLEDLARPWCWARSRGRPGSEAGPGHVSG
jgi:prevent-host-death family protein